MSFCIRVSIASIQCFTSSFLQSIGGASPRANIENTVPVFIALNVNYFEIIQPVITSLMSQENYPAPAPSLVQKDRFLKDVLK